MVWDKVKENLQKTLAANIYNLWIMPLQLERLEENEVVLSCPDRYFAAYVKQNFIQLIESSFAENGMVDAVVKISDKKIVMSPAPVVGTKRKKGTKKQMRLPSVPVNNSKSRNLHPRYTFDEFMVGESNILAESACRSMVKQDGLVGPCLYINSDTGLGKSHLTHAVAHKVIAESPMTRLHYLTAKQFAAEMVRGIQNKNMDDFKQKYQENCDILLVEDIHTLTGKKKTQEELNDVLDSLIKSGKRVILTANSSPRELVGIDTEFRSRMSSGLVTSINAPDIDTRCRIVECKAKKQQLKLSDDAISYLGGHIKGDVRKIESSLIGIRAKAQLTGGHVDMDLVREVVESVIGCTTTLSAAAICDLVSAQFRVSIKDLQSRSRKKAITVPRQIAMYLARKHTEESLVDIGRIFNRDHSTVLHSVKVVTNKLVRDSSVNAQLQILDSKVQQL